MPQRRVTSPERLPVAIHSSVYLRAADREQLELERSELFVVAAAVDEVGPEAGYGPQSVLWVRGPWGDGERVLALRLNGFRRRQVAALRDALRRADEVGPFVLVRRPTGTGHAAWALSPAADAQLSLEDEGRS